MLTRQIVITWLEQNAILPAQVVDNAASHFASVGAIHSNGSHRIASLIDSYCNSIARSSP
jgi:hypothetical protein